MTDSSSAPRPSADIIANARRSLEQHLSTSRVLAEAETCAAYGANESGLSGATPDLRGHGREPTVSMSTTRFSAGELGGYVWVEIPKSQQ
jgi:hypothetical protein